jgi:hypothetical protein
MFLNLTLASGHTSPIIASGILNPCPSALHVSVDFCLRINHVARYRYLGLLGRYYTTFG